MDLATEGEGREQLREGGSLGSGSPRTRGHASGASEMWAERTLSREWPHTASVEIQTTRAKVSPQTLALHTACTPLALKRWLPHAASRFDGGERRKIGLSCPVQRGEQQQRR